MALTQVPDIQTALLGLLADFQWRMKGMIDEDYTLFPLPKDPAIVTSVIEEVIKQRVTTFLRQTYQCEILQGGAREYPEIAIWDGNLRPRKIALDVKTTRRDSNNPHRVSGFTLGSFAGYFMYPNQKRPGCVFPYGEFTEHYVIGFIYDWNPEGNTLHMVSSVEVIVQPKWKIASRSTGTGTTNAIGSVKSIQALREGRGAFASEQEFEEYWRTKGSERESRRT